MLAVATTEALSIIDQATLKKAPSSFPSCLSLLSPPIATAWSPDNKFLFVASENTIHKYDPGSNSLVHISIAEGITSLIAKDKTSAVFSAGDKVHVLENGKISQTFTSHKNVINSLALSNDSTLLASTSANAVYVQNLTLSSQTSLRGLPVSDEHTIATCTFHPHSRTRLLLGIGKQLVVYDTTKPSGPLKTISLNETSSGDIGSISCSPFSKTLVAVATTGGTLGLVDLDKEKGLFRTINIKVPLASLSFSPEGANIYLGTENGKLLILDLRALDKPPKTIVVSETGARLATMSVQAKVSSSKTSEPTARKPSVTIASVTKPSPARRVVSASLKGKTPMPMMSISTTGVLKKSPNGKDREPTLKKVFSPLRNPLGASNANSNDRDEFSLQIESISALRGVSKQSKSTPVKADQPRTALALSNSRARETTGGPVSAQLRPPTSSSPLSVSNQDGARRTRTTSTTSKATAFSPLSASASKNVKDDTVVAPRRMRTVSTSSTHVSRGGKSSSVTESISTATSRNHLAAQKDSKKPLKSSLSPNSERARLGLGVRTRAVSSTSHSISNTRPAARTPSPDLSDIEGLASPGPDLGPVTPLTRRGFPVVASDTPGNGHAVNEDDDENIDILLRGGKSGKNSGKGKARVVLFQNPSHDEEGSNEGDPDDERESGKENQQETGDESLSLQISPDELCQASHLHSNYANIPGSPGGTTPQDFLRNIVRDVMYDFHQESRAEMMGLHLDLVRMGRGWKKELRELMGEYGGELKELKEENKRLKEENERLRRGY
ncbi:WD40-repeat-containing domain protein [Rhodocollybia butyracea]|uniref:WD40-repeat-containing domain protein n=1 Tax=Rhodocollybia butyracea TaxID=206335 RepID=A0A9P5PMZ7_9AGAR|nr:WD40-repeat-containing domain protein [Rhodocollybia butyracea]